MRFSLNFTLYFYKTNIQGEVKSDGIKHAMKCLKKVHALLTNIASREQLISRENAEAVRRGQAQYFALIARHNNLAKSVFRLST